MRRRRSSRFALPALPALALFAALLASAAPRPLAAQVIRGRLLDAESGAPIVVGLVSAVDPDGEPIARALSGAAGEFILVVRDTVPVTLQVQRIGYFDSMAGPFELGAGDTIGVVLRMIVQPIELDHIVVKVPPIRRHLVNSGFYERRKTRQGRYLTPEDLERMKPPFLSTALRRMLGVRLVPARGGFGGYHVSMRSFAGLSNYCRPRVFVDGLDIGYDRGIGFYNNVDEIVPAVFIDAIEVYSSSSVPAQYAGITGCGAILIWTKR